MELERFIPDNPSLAHLFPAPGDDLQAQRIRLRAFAFGRDGRCWNEGCSGDGLWYLHEGVYRRGDVQGWSKELRVIIHCPYCCVALCGRCHNTELEPSRMDVADWMLIRYGRDFVNWCRHLPFKINPIRGWLSQFSY